MTLLQRIQRAAHAAAAIGAGRITTISLHCVSYDEACEVVDDAEQLVAFTVCEYNKKWSTWHSITLSIAGVVRVTLFTDHRAALPWEIEAAQANAEVRP